MESKKCTQCNKELSINNFYRDRTIITKEGYRSKCKNCCKTNSEIRKSNDKDISITNKKCNICNIEKEITNFYKSTRHIDGYFSFCKICHIEKTKNIGNNPQIKRTVEYMKEYNKKKYSTAENKIKYSIRKSLLTYVKEKKNKTIEYMGCEMNFFKKWIQSNFDNNMNWDNHGSYWHFDHIKPCSSFDLTNEEEINKCYNWSNFRPFFKTDNIIKSDKINLDLINEYIKKKEKFLKENKDSINIKNKMYVLNVLLPEVKTLTCI